MGTYATRMEIDAPPDRVFEHFVRPELLVRWMGDYAALDAQPEGTFAVDINGVLIRGHYVRVERPHLVEIAWGEAGNPLMPPGSTHLLIRLWERPGGTLLELEHRGLVETEAAKHAIGWPHFLERLLAAAAGRDPGPDPWRTSPPVGAAPTPPSPAGAPLPAETGDTPSPGSRSAPGASTSGRRS